MVLPSTSPEFNRDPGPEDELDRRYESRARPTRNSFESLVIELQAPVAVGVDELCDCSVPHRLPSGATISWSRRTHCHMTGVECPPDWASVNLNDENVARNRWSFKTIARRTIGANTGMVPVSHGSPLVSDLYAFTVPDDGDYRVITYVSGRPTPSSLCEVAALSRDGC